MCACALRDIVRAQVCHEETDFIPYTLALGRPAQERLDRCYGSRDWSRKILESIHKAGKKIINHVCGSVVSLIPDVIELELDILESVQPEAAGMNPYKLKRRYGRNLALWGGLGCQSVVTFGTPEQLRAEIRKLRRGMSRGGGYIMSPAKTINETVSEANLVAIYETFVEENERLG